MMKIIFDELKKIIICLAVLCSLCIVVAAAMNKLDYTCFLGLLLGSVFMVLNFALLGTTIEKAIIKTPKSAKRFMILHYSLRFILTGIIIFIGFKADYLNGICVCVPLFAPKLTYFAIGFFDFFNILFRKKVDKP
ncbi:MAG: ATP synthase subunit I [Oscillospiraceae bacterium]